QEIEIEEREIADFVEPGWVIGLSETGVFRREDFVVLRQFVEECHPAGVTAGAMQKNQRAGARNATTEQADCSAVDRRPLRLVRHDGFYSPSSSARSCAGSCSISPSVLRHLSTAAAHFLAPPKRSRVSGGTNLISTSAVPGGIPTKWTISML